VAAICPRPVTLTFDLEVGVGVACDLGYPCAKFRLPRPFSFRVRADVRDIRQTDGQMDDGRRSPLNAPPTGRGHNKDQRQLNSVTRITGANRNLICNDRLRITESRITGSSFRVPPLLKIKHQFVSTQRSKEGDSTSRHCVDTVY